MIDDIWNSIGLDDDLNIFGTTEEEVNVGEEDLLSNKIDHLSSINCSESINNLDESLINDLYYKDDSALASYDIENSIFSTNKFEENVHSEVNHDFQERHPVSNDLLEPLTFSPEIGDTGVIEPHVDYLKIGDNELSELNERANGIVRGDYNTSEISFGGKLDPHVCQQLHACSGHAYCDKCYGSTITSL